MISINRQSLFRGLKLASSICPSKGTMPILSSVRIRQSGSVLSVSATDLVVSITADLRCSTIGESDSFAVKAKDLTDLVANAPGDEVHINVGENSWLDIKSGKVKYKLAAQSDRDFPRLPDPMAGGVTIESAVLQEMISRTAFAVATDENRVNMAGINVRSDTSRLSMASTDGHRMCAVSRSAPGVDSCSVILPRKGADAIYALTQQGPMCKLVITPRFMWVRQDDTTIVVQLIDAVYPDISPVMQAPRANVLACDRIVLMQAMKRASLMTDESIPIRMACSTSGCSITTVNPDMGEVSEEIESTYVGVDMRIGFNPKFVVDLVSRMTSDGVKIEMSGELDPVVIRPASGEDYSGIVMPMRIS